MSTASQLEQAIARFVGTARERSAGGKGGPFRYYSISNAHQFGAAIKGAPGEHRVLSTGDAGSGFSSEMCSLKAGNVRFTYYTSQGGWAADFGVDPDYLTVFHIIAGERTFSVGGTTVATARPGDYVFVINKSPLFQVVASDGSAGVSAYIKIPPAQRFILGSRPRTDAHVRSFLDNGFVIAGRSDLWGVHLGYALDHALDAVVQETGPNENAILLQEYLYLLFCHELATRAEERDAKQQYVSIPLKLQIAETYVANNAEQAPSVEAVATEAGLSVRNLHNLFVKFRGTSPREFIRESRLVGVRAALRKAETDTTVSDIASDWGYQNFGNFAAAYKKRFGELPSETLGRARQGGPSGA